MEGPFRQMRLLEALRLLTRDYWPAYLAAVLITLLVLVVIAP